MDVTLMDSGIERLQSPNFLFSLSELAGIVHAQSLWTWAALVLAAIATFTSLVARIRALILRLRNNIPTSPLPTLAYDSDDGDETCSSCSSDDESGDGEEEEQEEEGERPTLRGWRWSFSEDLWPGGWGLGVVKEWGDDSDEEEEEERLQLSLANSPSPSPPLLSLWGRSGGAAVRPFVGDQIETERRSVIMSAGKRVRVWDARAGGEVPAMIATEWYEPGVPGVSTLGDWEVVYSNADDGTASLVDLRNPTRELAAEEPADEMWWDAK